MDKEFSSIFERLKLMKECPLCANSYEADKVTILEENNNSHLVHMTCPECKSSILNMIMVTQIGMNCIGIITDLSAMEVANFRRRSKIGEDDLLEFHKFINKKDNNFEQVILKYK